MKRITKKQQAEHARFISAAAALLAESGAKVGSERVGIFGIIYDYQLDTPHGRIYCTIASPSVFAVGTVFCRFDDIEQGRAFGANPYSGKWNHHYFAPWNCDQALHDFAYQLNKVLAG